MLHSTAFTGTPCLFLGKFQHAMNKTLRQGCFDMSSEPKLSVKLMMETFKDCALAMYISDPLWHF